MHQKKCIVAKPRFGGIIGLGDWIEMLGGLGIVCITWELGFNCRVVAEWCLQREYSLCDGSHGDRMATARLAQIAAPKLCVQYKHVHSPSRTHLLRRASRTRTRTCPFMCTLSALVQSLSMSRS